MRPLASFPIICDARIIEDGAEREARYVIAGVQVFPIELMTTQVPIREVRVRISMVILAAHSMGSEWADSD